MLVYRLCKERYSSGLLTGEGGMHADGRWHFQGRPIIYCASSEALAALELRVHIGVYLPLHAYTMHEVAVPDAHIQLLNADKLPKGWDAIPHSRISQEVGDAWLKERNSLALRVSSIHSRTEWNVLLNPEHKALGDCSVRRTWTYRFDPRLFA